MGKSGIYGQAGDAESLATIRAAVDGGQALRAPRLTPTGGQPQDSSMLGENFLPDRLAAWASPGG